MRWSRGFWNWRRRVQRIEGPVDPRVSLITPSHGRREFMLQKLASLAAQRASLRHVEVVLVDNGCPQQVASAVEAKALAEGWPFAIKVLRSAQQLPAAEARTWAAREAAQPLLWWSDDDVVFDRDALSGHWARQCPGGCVTIGSTRFEFDNHRSEFRPGFIGPAQLTGANSMLPRSALLAAVDRLPMLPQAYGGEEALVGWALKRQGVVFRAAPDSWATHLGSLPANLSGDEVRAAQAGFNAVAIAVWFPESAWAHGVHPWLLHLKGLLQRRPLRQLMQRSPRGRFELAYWRGARAARRPGALDAWLGRTCTGIG